MTITHRTITHGSLHKIRSAKNSSVKEEGLLELYPYPRNYWKWTALGRGRVPGRLPHTSGDDPPPMPIWEGLVRLHGLISKQTNK